MSAAVQSCHSDQGSCHDCCSRGSYPHRSAAAKQPCRVVHEGQSGCAALRLLGRREWRAERIAAGLRDGRRARRSGNPRRHQGLRQLADDSTVVCRRRTGRRLGHHPVDVHERRVAGTVRSAETRPHAAADHDHGQGRGGNPQCDGRRGSRAGAAPGDRRALPGAIPPRRSRTRVDPQRSQRHRDLHGTGDGAARAA